MFGPVVGIEARGVSGGNELEALIVLLGQGPVTGQVDVVEQSELQGILREMRRFAGPVVGGSYARTDSAFPDDPGVTAPAVGGDAGARPRCADRAQYDPGTHRPGGVHREL